MNTDVPTHRVPGSPKPSVAIPRLFANLLQVLLVTAVLFLCTWVKLPPGCTLAFALLGAVAIFAGFGCKSDRPAYANEVPSLASVFSKTASAWGPLVVWVSAGVLAFGLWLGRKRFDFTSAWDTYYAGLAAMAAAVLCLTEFRVRAQHKPAWRVVTVGWGLVASALWIGATYSRNDVVGFYVALAGAITLLVVWQLWLLPGTSIRLVLNTGILLLVALPVTDLFRQSDATLQRDPSLRKAYYSYAAARKDPTAFARWWDFYLEQWAKTERAIVLPDPEGYLPFRLRPNSHSVLMQCPISINSRGFRGAEIPAEKGNTYRIVTLGESTTFGITLNKDDRPWPELLQDLIRQSVKSSRPVEVINAGVPGYSLDGNVHRFEKDILPLQPDMIISYHGINGFPMLYDAMPSRRRTTRPAYQERPIRLLGDCEYRVKLMLFRNQESRLVLHPPKISDPLNTGYARDYVRLVELARTNHIRLVLANYSMAVNDKSDGDVVRFYQVGYPAAPWLIRANELHSGILKELARRYSDVCLLDTHPELDGDPERFIDLVHFSPEGERQMAESVYTGIRSILEAELGPSGVARKSNR